MYYTSIKDAYVHYIDSLGDHQLYKFLQIELQLKSLNISYLRKTKSTDLYFLTLVTNFNLLVCYLFAQLYTFDQLHPKVTNYITSY